VPVLGDGTCLWHALVATGAIPDVRTARNAVADMVEEDQEQMANIQAFVTNATSAEIVRQIRQSGQFNSETGDLIPILITIKYGFRLRIFEPDTTLELADMGGAWHSVIHFTSPGMHYHAARPQAGV